jgi:flagellar biosynthesis protein FliQ
MTEADIIEITRDGMWTALLISGPALFIALVVGLGIGFLQALTQIQESTLVFVPKIVAVAVGSVLLLPFMVATLGAYTEHLMSLVQSID